MPSLTDLLRGLEEIVANPASSDIDIVGITADSRNVQKGFLFCAISGASEDGGAYIADAIEKGAAAILTPTDFSPEKTNVLVLTSHNPRLAYAKLCAAFWPDQPEQMVAVTGTNGKTSVAEFYRQLWVLAGEKAASIGTLGLTLCDGSPDTHWLSSNTSPAAELLHPALQHLAQSGVHYVALEASSHGLDQCRLHGVRLTATAFTNLTQDHLDYHKTMQAYFAAKSILFADFAAPAAINADDAYGQKLLQQYAQAKSYGRTGSWLKLVNATPTSGGFDFALQYDGRIAEFSVPLYGEFQIENIMAAGALALLSGMSWSQLCDAIPKLQGVRGRMEKVGAHPSGAPIFIDYAHTPDALKHLLISLRAHCANKLHVVFGCGGDRDRTKRAPMGNIAAAYADRVIVTDDNPRSEDAQSIRRHIIINAPQAIEIADRAQAIRQAIEELSAGDLLVVAGKGHETYQIIGNKSYEFNDAHVIKEALGAL